MFFCEAAVVCQTHILKSFIGMRSVAIIIGCCLFCDKMAVYIISYHHNSLQKQQHATSKIYCNTTLLLQQASSSVIIFILHAPLQKNIKYIVEVSVYVFEKGSNYFDWEHDHTAQLFICWFGRIASFSS